MRAVGSFTGTPITIRLTKSDDKIVRTQMKGRGVKNRSEFLRMLITESASPPLTLDVLRRELKRHGLKVAKRKV